MKLPVDSFFLNHSSQGTLQSRIQEMITTGILNGRLPKGAKLPSTRKLATHLGVSRITVTLAYTELLANDYLTSKGRSGYYVSDTAPEPPQFSAQPPREERVDWTRAIGQKFTGSLQNEKPLDWARYEFPFIYGQTDPTLFDHANWRQCALQALGTKDFGSLTSDYYDRDDPRLIEFIARHTLPRRGISANPDEILVTLGAQNALWLTAQVLLTQRRTATIENPCYPALRDILNQSRCHVQTIDVDQNGLQPDLIPDDTTVIFTTPSHHCPTAATLPIERRHALLKRARDLDALIVEDDYEFELSFLKPPSPSLKSLDQDGRVIYVGSFSKSLFPGLRLGYLVGSEPFIREARALRASVFRHPPGHIQRTAAYFLSLGHYDSLIRKMGSTFQKRRKIMEESIQKTGLDIAGRGVFGGSSFWMRAPSGVNVTELSTRLRARGVLIESGDAFFAENQRSGTFYRLAYSSIAETKIPRGIEIIGEEIAKTGPKSG